MSRSTASYNFKHLNTAARDFPTNGDLFSSNKTSRCIWRTKMISVSTATSSKTSETSQRQTTTSFRENYTGVSASFVYGIVAGIGGSIVVITIVIAILAFMRTLEARLPWTTYELPRFRRSHGRQRSENPVEEQEHVYSVLMTGHPPPVPTHTCTPGHVSVGDLTGDPTLEAVPNTRPPPVPPRPATPALTKLRKLTQTFKLPAVHGPSKT